MLPVVVIILLFLSDSSVTYHIHPVATMEECRAEVDGIPNYALTQPDVVHVEALCVRPGYDA